MHACGYLTSHELREPTAIPWHWNCPARSDGPLEPPRIELPPLIIELVLVCSLAGRLGTSGRAPAQVGQDATDCLHLYSHSAQTFFVVHGTVDSIMRNNERDAIFKIAFTLQQKQRATT